MLHQLKNLVPQGLKDTYHLILSYIAAILYSHPSRRLIVIGVTGTNGKTSTAYMIAKALEAGGAKTGCTTTAIFKVAEKEWLNNTKMTMLGRFQLQKLLREMVDSGCTYAVIETSSQGITQHRHKNIAYDIGVFTNLTPEHIEAHGGFENYKQAKIQLFRHIASLPPKMLGDKLVPRASVINFDDEHSVDFKVAGLENVITYGEGEGAEVHATNITETTGGASFDVDNHQIKLNLLGRVNVSNALASLAVAKACGMDLDSAVKKLETIKNLPGRFELINEGQPYTVIVDYAPEPASLSKIYETINALNPNRLIHVLGSCGGGRDVARRPILGKMAGETADIVIVTNEDPYDDDPMQIINDVAEGAKEQGKIEGQNLFLIEDRKEAIDKAIGIAEPGDIVLLTGKGSEQAICIAGGKKIPWDEREVAREAIKNHIAKPS
ncbi:MAG: UDP-N-acetylmuramoyl-L-alanyl-D-glutamate--2,6-diaminopimelate ligase [Patescibacteria group bacterium]|nr:UDP-N-acetylmuramoyl-L-alanyl-D-glutamate--2,6-diaminopimelate ligase [Patescibacteria group bacterium]